MNEWPDQNISHQTYREQNKKHLLVVIKNKRFCLNVTFGVE